LIGIYNPFFHEELARRVEKEAAEKAGMLAQGTAEDFGSYRYSCGEVAGMRRVIDIADEIRQEMDRN